MLIVYLCIILRFAAAIAQAQPPSAAELSARGLDSLLQDFAFRAFLRPKTGIVYDGNVPSNLTGIKVAAMRLRSGSLRRRGVAAGYKEFRIPTGVVEQPYAERLVLVYHNLGNLSSMYYPLPGYSFLAPVLGLLAYDAADLSATNPPELDIRAAGDPISVVFSGVRSDRPRLCVFFGVDGSVVFDSVVRGNTCLMTNQGHISIVVESLVAPAPAPSGGGVGGGGGGGRAAVAGGGGGGKMGKKEWVIGGCVVGGAAMVGVLAVVIVCVRRCGRRKKLRRMEDAAEVGVDLPMTRVGYTKAPVALETRTRPLLENEFVP